ncbi:prolactin regulatory element-binding protein isoform X2 [Lutzomyia longipalpis]|nr:prolactin regulatory element-binding protein isoform X2 [Lutzomyia longipalpis]
MPPLRRPNEGLLARVNFPLYSIEMLSSRHVLVAGGGGSAKTGVANGFEIYEIYHNGDRFVAEEVVRHETGPSVVMNCAVRSDGRRSFLVAGQESHCQMYLVNTKIIDENGVAGKAADGEEKTTTRQRRTSVRQNQNSGIEEIPQEAPPRRLSFDIKPSDSVQTDFLDREPIQRVVRLSLDCKVMATGGTDGRLRLWNFPRMTKLRDIAAHSKELDDLDFSPDGKLVVSIAKDGLGVIWDVASGKEAGTLTWQPPEGVKYLFKRCRFGVIEDKKNKCRLFTLANPLGKSGKQRGFLQQWDPETGTLQRAIGVDESLSALCVRDDGRFVALGTMFSGTVSIHIAFSLQRVLHIPNAHSMFVTGLQFLPVLSSDGPAISSDAEAAVLSISVDNRICIHSLQYRHTLPAWAAIILIVVMLFLTFMLCSFMGL